MAQSDNANDNLGFELNTKQTQVPQKNVSATPIEFLISIFFSNTDFNSAELFYAVNMVAVKDEEGSST